MARTSPRKIDAQKRTLDAQHPRAVAYDVFFKAPKGFHCRVYPNGTKIFALRFRDAIGNACLDYGAAYFPWLHTAVVHGGDLDGLSFEREAGAAPVPPTDALREAAKQQLNLLPPSAAMAGVYTMVDNTRGVWKAPANVTVAGAVKPAVALTAEEQAGLNVSAGGKSINAIRSFIGEGVLV